MDQIEASTNASNRDKARCSLLIFLATPSEETGLEDAAKLLGLPFERIKQDRSPFGEKYCWLGQVGNETVIAIPPARFGSNIVMGSVGVLGTAARGMRMKIATGAQAIVQVGMAFGIDPGVQKPADVLVSTWLIPYDNRDIKPSPHEIGRYLTDYTPVIREPARLSLVDLFRREKDRGGHDFGISLGAILSGAARIHTRIFRDELIRDIPKGEDPIVGGEMEGVGLLAASTTSEDPIWCVVKGISDFADEDRDAVFKENRPHACFNAARFVLSALLNDGR